MIVENSIYGHGVLAKVDFFEQGSNLLVQHVDEHEVVSLVVGDFLNNAIVGRFNKPVRIAAVDEGDITQCATKLAPALVKRVYHRKVMRQRPRKQLLTQHVVYEAINRHLKLGKIPDILALEKGFDTDSESLTAHETLEFGVIENAINLL